MNIMNVLKSHRYESICGVLVLLLLASLWPAATLGSKAKVQAADVADLDDSIARLLLPGKNGVANIALVTARREQVKRIEGQAKHVVEQFKQRNQRQFLLPDLFDGKNESRTSTWSFREKYKKAVEDIYGTTLNAGWPGEPLNPSESKQAEEFGMYVENQDVLGTPDWVRDPGAPTIEQCWFGQLALWIQQDLTEVFNNLNHDWAKQRGQEPRVTNAAVKRIIQIDVSPSYYVTDIKQSQNPATNMFAPPGMPGMPGMPPGPHGAGPGPGFGGELPFGQQTITAAGLRAQRKKGLMAKSFTKRISNENADVLHFSFSVIVDSRCINELLAALSRKNLYTIFKLSLSRQDVLVDRTKFKQFNTGEPPFDPDRDAEEDLIYGSDPIVKLNVNVEALFLREIYAEHMPTKIKDDLEKEIAKATGRTSSANSSSRTKTNRSSRR